MALFANDYLVRGCCNLISLDGDGSNTLTIATADLIKAAVSGASPDTIGITVGTPNIGSVVQTYDSLLVKIPPCGTFKTYVLQGSVPVDDVMLMTTLGFAIGEAYPSFMGAYTGGIIAADTTVSDVLFKLLSMLYLNADIGPATPQWDQGYYRSGFTVIRRGTDFTPEEIQSLDKRLWGDVQEIVLNPGPSDAISGQMSVPITYRDNELNVATANVVVSISACKPTSNSNANTNTVTLHADDISIDVCCEADSVNPALIAIQAILANAAGDGLTLTGLSMPMYGNAQITANGITYQSPPCGSFPAPPIAGHDTVTIIPNAPPKSDCPYYGPNLIYTEVGPAGRDYGTDNPTMDVPMRYIPAAETPGQIGGDVYALGWVITYAGQKFSLAPGWQQLTTVKSGGFTLTAFARTFDPSELTAIAPATQIIPMLLDVDIVNGDDGRPTMYLDYSLFSCLGRTTTPRFRTMDIFPVGSGTQVISPPNYGIGKYVKAELVLLTNADSGFTNPIVSVPAGAVSGYGHHFIKDYAMTAAESGTAVDPTDGLSVTGQDAGFRIYRVFDGIYECIQVG